MYPSDLRIDARASSIRVPLRHLAHDGDAVQLDSRSVVVLDGSSSQSRKMMQRVPEFRALQRWSLPAPAGRRSLRASPPGGMSSLEAIAEALSSLEGAELGARVRAVHEALIRKQLDDRGYVGPHRN